MFNNYMQCTNEIASTIREIVFTIREITATSKISLVGRCALASFGYWWRDHPEYHRLLFCEAQNNHLFLRFDNDVSLIIKSPKDVEQFDGSLIVWAVDSLTWNWRGFGDDYSPTNNFYRKYRLVNGNMRCGSNEGKSPLWHYTPRAYHPAFVITWDMPSGPPGPYLCRLRDRGKERERQQLEHLYQHQSQETQQEAMRFAG